jgi:hypothetical protein
MRQDHLDGVEESSLDRRWTILVMVLLMLSVTATQAEAHREEDTTTLSLGEHLAVLVENPGDGDIDVRYFVVVTEGPPVDVFFMNEEAYDDYENAEEFSYYSDYSVLNSSKVDEAFVWDGEGDYFVVIDFTSSGTEPPIEPDQQTVTVTYVITWDHIEKTDVRTLAIYVIIGLAAVFAVFLAFRYLRKPK